MVAQNIEPVDYKSREPSNLITKEFSSHHRYDSFFISFIINKAICFPE